MGGVAAMSKLEPITPKFWISHAHVYNSEHPTATFSVSMGVKIENPIRMKI